MKNDIITYLGKDYAPILVGAGECCLNCDIGQKRCWTQCHEFEESDDENVALKEVRHKKKSSLWKKMKEIFTPIMSDSDTPF